MANDELTDPRITEAQNTSASIRLLTAQRQLYKEINRSREQRLAVLAVLTLATLIASEIAPGRDYIGAMGAVVMGVWVAVAELRERATADTAAGIQERFDTELFQLGWNEFLVDRPAEWRISEAASRGSAEALPEWYRPKEISSVRRPLDVLICQQANLGYGVSLHQTYAKALETALVGASVVALGVGVLLHYSALNLLFAVICPLAPIGFEIAKEALAHRDSASQKTSAQSKIDALWRQGLADPTSISVADCRNVQDCVLEFRKSNARVPDRVYDYLRGSNEAVMEASCQALVDEARRRGHVLD